MTRAVPRAGDRGAAHLRRLRWHCRRGMKELDVLLERFAEQALGGASGAELGAFAELLALPDPALARYLLDGEVPAAPHLAELVGRIRALCRSEGGSAVFCP